MLTMWIILPRFWALFVVLVQDCCLLCGKVVALAANYLHLYYLFVERSFFFPFNHLPGAFNVQTFHQFFGSKMHMLMAEEKHDIRSNSCIFLKQNFY